MSSKGVKSKENAFHSFELVVNRISEYKFIIDFGKETMPNLLMDEEKIVPGGEELGPNASMLIAAAVGNCLSASLIFCLRKKGKLEVTDMKTKVKVTRSRNEQGYWRISKIDVFIDTTLDEYENKKDKLDQCLKIFRNYCIASTSIMEGIPIDVEVNPK